MAEDQSSGSGDPGPDPAAKKITSRGGVTQFRPKTGGLLNRGGTPGHDGSNAGATPKVIRQQLREMFVENIDVLRKLSRDAKASPATRMKALELMVKYGAGTPSSTLNNEGDAVEPSLIIREVNEHASTHAESDEEGSLLGEGDAPA